MLMMSNDNNDYNNKNYYKNDERYDIIVSTNKSNYTIMNHVYMASPQNHHVGSASDRKVSMGMMANAGDDGIDVNAALPATDGIESAMDCVQSATQ